MGEENELERRAVEELLKEASRGRVRAETMGPAGWMKCPLGSTNKRFLLNTLRPCAAERRSGSQTAAWTKEKERRCDGDRERYYRSKDRDRGSIKESQCRRERSHSQTGCHTSNRSTLTSRSHSPRPTSQSKRTNSRSPIRERSASKKSSGKDLKEK